MPLPLPLPLLPSLLGETRLLADGGGGPAGGGGGGDIQFLFAEDILGNNPPPYPRHSKQYKNLYKMKQEMQAERVAGFKEFIDDVKKGICPAKEHTIQAPNNLIEEFLDELEDEL